MMELIQEQQIESQLQPTPKNPPKISIDVAILSQNARVLLKHKEYGLAQHLLREALQKDSKNLIVLKLLAEAFSEDQKWREAEKVFAFICQNESNFENVSARGHNLYKLGEDEKALPVYFEALALITDDQEDIYEIYKNMGNIFVRRGDYDSAEENYNKAYTRFPCSDVLLVNYGTLEVQRGDLDKALSRFRQAVEVNALNDKAWVGLGMIHCQFGDLELAWGNLIKALDINPQNRTALILLAQWSGQSQFINSIIEKFCIYFEQNADDAELSVLFIRLLLESGQKDLAELELTKAICFDPHHPDLVQLWQYFRQKEDSIEI